MDRSRAASILASVLSKVSRASGGMIEEKPVRRTNLGKNATGLAQWTARTVPTDEDILE